MVNLFYLRQQQVIHFSGEALKTQISNAGLKTPSTEQRATEDDGKSRSARSSASDDMNSPSSPNSPRSSVEPCERRGRRNVVTESDRPVERDTTTSTRDSNNSDRRARANDISRPSTVQGTVLTDSSVPKPNLRFHIIKARQPKIIRSNWRNEERLSDKKVKALFKEVAQSIGLARLESIAFKLFTKGEAEGEVLSMRLLGVMQLVTWRCAMISWRLLTRSCKTTRRPIS